jgi:hypothetical protein
MITTGSKFLIGSAVLATIAAVVYGVMQDGVMGTIGLASAAVCLIGLATLNVLVRDSNVFVDDAAPAETAAAAQVAPGASVWPLGFALSGVIIAVGLVSYQPIVVIGLAALLVTGAEWAVQGWSERASGDEAHNAEVRSRFSNPLEYPVGGAVAIGVVIYAFSRVMLWLSKTNTVVAFSVLAGVVLAIGFAFAFRPSAKAGAIGGTMAVGVIAIVAAGTAAGLDGQRTIPEFETTAIWMEEALAHPDEYAEGAAEGEHPAELICESPEEFPEADEGASQTVAAKSGAYQVILQADGTLAFDVPGPIEVNRAGMVIPRSNPTNVIFRNESNELRRLSIDLGTEENEDGEAQPHLICTTLIEEGAAQLLTLTVGAPTIAHPEPNRNGPTEGTDEDRDGYWFFVPGVDTAKLELIVP